MNEPSSGCCTNNLSPSDLDLEKGTDATHDRSDQTRDPLHGLDCTLVRYQTRPDLAALIRDPVEMSYGETSVIVCGGLELTSRVRNIVASLSDERAVHKGTGAQGIHLHVEEYSF